MDVERAKKESPFGTTIAHGNLTLCLLRQLPRPALQGRVRLQDGHQLRLEQGALHVAGAGRARASAPASRRSSVDEKGDGWYQLVQKWTVEIEGQEKPALFAESVVRLLA